MMKWFLLCTTLFLIATTSTIDWKHMTAESIHHLPPAIFQNVTSEDIQLIPAEAVAGFTVLEIGFLSMEALSGFSADQVRYLTPSACSGINANQFGNFSVDAFSGFVADCLKATKPEVWYCILPQQVAAIADSEFSGLRSWHIGNLKPETIGAISQEKISMMSFGTDGGCLGIGSVFIQNLKADSFAGFCSSCVKKIFQGWEHITAEKFVKIFPSVFSALSETQLASVNGTSFSELTSDHIFHLQDNACSGLSINHIQNLKPESFEGFQRPCIDGMKPSVFAGIDEFQVSHITPQAFESMDLTKFSQLGGSFRGVTGEQIRHLSSNGLRAACYGFTSSHIFGFNEERLSNVSKSCISKIADFLFSLFRDEIKYIAPDTVRGITLEQISQIMPETFKLFTKEQLENIRGLSCAGIYGDLLNDITGIEGLSEFCITNIPTSSFTLLSRDALSNMSDSFAEGVTDDQFDKIPPGAFSGVTMEQFSSWGDLCSAFKYEQFNQLPTTSLSGMTLECFTSLSHLVFRHISPQIMDGLPVHLFGHISRLQLEQINTRAITVFRKEHFEQMKYEFMCDGFTSKQVREIDPEAFSGLQYECFRSMDNEAVSALSCDHLKNIPPSTFSGLLPYQLEGIARDDLDCICFEQIKDLQRPSTVSGLSDEFLYSFSLRYGEQFINLFESNYDWLGIPFTTVTSFKMYIPNDLPPIYKTLPKKAEKMNWLHLAFLQQHYDLNDEIDKFISNTMMGLMPHHMKKIKPENIAKLECSEVIYIMADAVSVMTLEQLNSIKPPCFANIYTHRIRVIPSKYIHKITPDRIQYLTPDQLTSMKCSQIKSLTDKQVEGFNESQNRRLEERQVDCTDFPTEDPDDNEETEEEIITTSPITPDKKNNITNIIGVSIAVLLLLVVIVIVATQILAFLRRNKENEYQLE
eukprot:TRINITY_DN8324_c0_g1_i1.p1 TRINITY_DN8324_c0_g1~~TRINITY_DN8324_c0_g1_i1.p1  ORF type:complete len:923 (+),score=178.32 TRINITY_DN8324_c0_g1_i1:263-3031(+)